jgi:hypothetical protein
MYAEFSKKYRPRKNVGIRILFVAESPPKPKDSQNPDYFYNEDTQQQKGKLWWHFNEVLYSGEERDKVGFLRRFQQDGYFLIDVFQTKQELVDIRQEVKMEEYENITRISQNLFKRIIKLKPEKVVFLGKTTAKLIAGNLPFRSEANVLRFKRFVKAAKET